MCSTHPLAVLAILGVAALAVDTAPNGKAEDPEPVTIRLEQAISAVQWSPDGQRIATRSVRWEKDPTGEREDGDWYSTLQLWDARTGKETLSFGEVKNSGTADVRFSADSKWLAVSYRLSIALGDKVELWDVATGGLERTIEMDYGRNPPFLAFAPDGKTLAVAHTTEQRGKGLVGGALLFELQTGTRKSSVFGHTSTASSLVFMPNGESLATGGHDGTIRLWEVASGRETQVLDTGQVGRIFSLSFSLNGKQLLSADEYGRVLLWDVAKQTAWPLMETSGRTVHVQFSPRGDWIVAGGRTEAEGKPLQEIKLWNARTGQLVRTWKEVVAASTAFAPDGQTLAVGHKDRAVRLWKIGRADGEK